MNLELASSKTVAIRKVSAKTEPLTELEQELLEIPVQHESFGHGLDMNLTERKRPKELKDRKELKEGNHAQPNEAGGRGRSSH
jgi:hypothetical protein